MDPSPPPGLSPAATASALCAKRMEWMSRPFWARIPLTAFAFCSALRASWMRLRRLFIRNLIETEVLLASVRDASELLGPLLDGGRSAVAGRSLVACGVWATQYRQTNFSRR
jgi:hypothetical protein